MGFHQTDNPVGLQKAKRSKMAIRRSNLEEELEFWGNASVADGLGKWKRDFLIGESEEDDEIEGYDAIEYLHKLGVKILPLLTEITQTRLIIGPAKTLRHQIASRKKRLKNSRTLERGLVDQKLEVIEKWGPVLKRYTPTLKINFLEAENEGNGSQRFYIIQTWDAVSKRFNPPLNLPSGIKRTRWCQIKAYPDRRFFESLPERALDRAVVHWIARCLPKLGPAQRHRLTNREINRCALKLEELIRSQIGRPCNREIEVLLTAAFPEYFGPKWGDGNMKLLKRARKEIRAQTKGTG